MTASTLLSLIGRVVVARRKLFCDCACRIYAAPIRCFPAREFGAGGNCGNRLGFLPITHITNRSPMFRPLSVLSNLRIKPEFSLGFHGQSPEFGSTRVPQ